MVKYSQRGKRYKRDGNNTHSRDADISDDFTEEEFTEEPEPTLAEIEHAIKELACNKAPGIDNITIELVKKTTQMNGRYSHRMA